MLDRERKIGSSRTIAKSAQSACYEIVVRLRNHTSVPALDMLVIPSRRRPKSGRYVAEVMVGLSDVLAV